MQNETAVKVSDVEVATIPGRGPILLPPVPPVLKMITAREKIYEALDSERSHQDTLAGDGRVSSNKSVPEEILLISHYVEKAKSEWAAIPSQNRAVLSSIRKIAALAIRCMENNGLVTR